MSIPPSARDTKLGSGRELTKRNLLLPPDLRERSPQTVLFQTRQGYNKPGSAIGAGDLRSRTFHADLHAELHHVENSRRADSWPVLARLARISFNWREPPPKNLKSSYSLGHPISSSGVTGKDGDSRLASDCFVEERFEFV